MPYHIVEAELLLEASLNCNVKFEAKIMADLVAAPELSWDHASLEDLGGRVV
jgi:hypothetical protein